MMNMLKFAVRNVARNKRRTLLTLTSLFFASVITAFAIGFVNGMVDELLANYVNFQTGHLKVTTTGYARFERFMPVDEKIAGSADLAEKLAAIPGVKSVEERARFGIMLGRVEESVAAVGVGMDLMSPRIELSNKLVEGVLEPTGLYIGSKLASKIGAVKGGELLLATRSSDGGLNGIKVPVKGLFSTGIEMFDSRFFYLDLANAKKLLKLGDSGVEIYLYRERGADPARIKAAIQKMLPAGLTVRTPSEQVGSMFDLMSAAKYIYYFMAALIIFLATFVIVNTMMMAVFERMQEIGTLKAMGMTDRELFWNFTLEGALIGAMGGISGGVAGYLLVLYYSIKGLNFSSIRGLEMPLNLIIYPYAGWLVLVLTIVLAVGLSALSAMIPARHARKLSPAEALRKL